MQMVEIDWQGLVDEWLPRMDRMTSMSVESEAQALWTGLSEDDQQRFRSYWRGAPHVGKARNLLADFRKEHGWTVEQSNAVGQYQMRQP